MKAAAVVLAVGLLGCESGEPMEPIGTWAVAVQYASGNCGFTGSSDATFAVTQAGFVGGEPVYLINGDDPLQGLFECDDMGCTLTASLTENMLVDGLSFQLSLSANLSLDADGSITGTGLVTMSGDVECSQILAYSGELR